MPQTAQTAARSRWLSLVVLCAGQLMIILDGSIVNVALPVIQRDLGFSQTNLAWVVHVYMIAFGSLLLLAGRLGDLIGRKRVFVTGLVVFTAASLLCGLSTSQGMLIGSRFLQGVGGATCSAVVLGMIAAMFPDERERAKAIGVFSFVSASGASIGLLAGGVLTQGLSWNWIFFVNIPIGVVALVLALRLFETDRGIGLRAGADVLGAILVTGGLMLLVYTISKTEEHGWGSTHTLGLGALSILLLAAFVARQARVKTPVLPLRVLRSRQVTGANLVQVPMVIGMFGFQLMGALYLQRVLGYSPAETGLAYLPCPLVIGVLSLRFAQPLIMRFGGRNVLLAGLVFTTAALALLSRVPVDGRYLPDVLPAMVLLGAGAGLALPAVTILAMSGATPGDSGLVSGLVNTTQQMGGALGIAVLVSLASARTGTLIAGGEGIPSALTEGYRLAFGVAAAILIGAVVLALTTLRGRMSTAPAPRKEGPAGEPKLEETPPSSI